MQPPHPTLTNLTEAQLGHIATTLAGHLVAGNALLLSGQIGAGKSVFARHIIRTLCPDELDIPSPTFTLIQTYDAPGFAIHHCDLYRLTAPDQCDELGLEDAFAHDVCLIEWPQVLGPLTPPGALHITLTVTGDAQRTMTFETTNPRWHAVIGGLHVA